jgi:outer membrane protein W
MKKIIYTLVLATVGFVSNSNAQATQGSIIIDPYYGFPNFGASFAKNFETAGNTGVEVKGLGPLGLRAEYVVSEKVGIGLDVIYNDYDVRYTSTDSVYDGTTGTYSVTSSSNRYTMQRLRVQARMNYHFETNNPNFDAYFGVGAGTNNRFRKAYENGVEVIDNVSFSNLTVIPVSFRVCTGFRYYFADNIGINFELGIGGPVMSGGLSMRF